MSYTPVIIEPKSYAGIKFSSSPNAADATYVLDTVHGNPNGDISINGSNEILLPVDKVLQVTARIRCTITGTEYDWELQYDPNGGTPTTLTTGAFNDTSLYSATHAANITGNAPEAIIDTFGATDPRLRLQSKTTAQNGTVFNAVILIEEL